MFYDLHPQYPSVRTVIEGAHVNLAQNLLYDLEICKPAKNINIKFMEISQT